MRRTLARLALSLLLLACCATCFALSKAHQRHDAGASLAQPLADNALTAGAPAQVAVVAPELALANDIDTSSHERARRLEDAEPLTSTMCNRHLATASTTIERPPTRAAPACAFGWEAASR